MTSEIDLSRVKNFHSILRTTGKSALKNAIASPDPVIRMAAALNSKTSHKQLRILIRDGEPFVKTAALVAETMLIAPKPEIDLVGVLEHVMPLSNGIGPILDIVINELKIARGDNVEYLPLTIRKKQSGKAADTAMFASVPLIE